MLENKCSTHFKIMYCEYRFKTSKEPTKNLLCFTKMFSCRLQSCYELWIESLEVGLKLSLKREELI